MANRGTRTVGRRPTDGDESPRAGAGPPPDHPVVVAFNGLRDELLSTLLYVLGNRDDALDAAQDAFLKCWKHRHETAGVQNLRAWIFRVGLNTAKDLQRSAWNRSSGSLRNSSGRFSKPEKRMCSGWGWWRQGCWRRAATPRSPDLNTIGRASSSRSPLAASSGVRWAPPPG